MHPQVEQLRLIFEANANPTEAVKMANYMKNIAPFFGIKSDQRKALAKAFFRQKPPPQYDELLVIVNDLWAQPERELHYVAIELMEFYKKKWQKTSLDDFEKLITTQSWWDTVDFISTHLVGAFFKKNPEFILPTTERWMQSDNLWLQRVCLIFQLAYHHDTDASLLFSYCRRLAGEKDFFIRKAIGWALRQHAKFDAESVKNFVKNTELSPLSIREALKHF